MLLTLHWPSRYNYLPLSYWAQLRLGLFTKIAENYSLLCPIIQVLDVTKQGFVDIKDYIVISSFGEHYFKEDAPDYSKFGNKLQALKVSLARFRLLLLITEQFFREIMKS